MDTKNEPRLEPQTSASKAPIALIFLGLAAMTLVVIVYMRGASSPKPYNDSGLNVNRVEINASAYPIATAFHSPSPQTRLYQGGSSGLPVSGKPGSKASGNAKARAAASLTQAIRRNEARYKNLAKAYSRKYPVIRQYGKDWMSHPDLRRFNDEYMRDHDPIKFAWNVAASPNFGALVKQYAHKPEVLAFCKDAAKVAPGELVQSVQDYLKADNRAVDLLSRFASGLGLPGTIFSGMASGNMDGRHAADAIIKDNPQLQSILRQNNIDPNRLNANF